MKKRKTYEISVIDKTYSKTYSDETKFYTSDTALELGFELKETEYNFESAEIVLLNIDDRSLVTRPVSKSLDSFAYELEDDITAHYGEWRGQLRFEQAGETYVSSPVKFRIENDLSNDRPPQLSDVQSWVSLKRYADKLTNELKQAVLSVEGIEDTFNANETDRTETFNANETTRQENENARIEAEKQREGTVANIETRQTFVENQFNAINQELTTKDIISAPEIIAARNGESDLKTRIDKDHQEVTAQLAQKAEQADLIATTKKVDDTPARGLPKILSYPVGFSFPMSLRIKRNLGGKFEVVGFDLESLQPPSLNKAYYVAIDGSDTNDGLSRQSAFRSITKALIRPDVDIIYIAGGEYGRQQAYTQLFPDRDLKMKAYNNEKVTIGCWDEAISWTLHENGTYKTSRSGTVGVYDTKILNSFGNYTRYQKKTTIADVVATAGAWFLDTDNQLYVHTLDNRQPASNTDIKVALGGWTIKGDKNRHYYFEGIEFQFGDASLEIANAKQVLAKNCQFNYSQMKNGLNINDTELIITQNCVSYENFADAFNYHADNWSTKHSYFLEIDNIGFRNGWSGATLSNNNGTTSHVNCVGIRVNGLYFENNGPNIADVGPRNLTWDIGCTAYDSRYIGGGFTGIDFLTENKKWMDGCIAYGSDISTYEGTPDGVIYIRDSILKKVNQGNVVPY